MKLFFLTHSVIGSINDEILIFTNQQVVLMGLVKPHSYFIHLHTAKIVANSKRGQTK